MKDKGAIFDMDGLLFDTERIFQETWQEIASRCGILLATEFPEAISGTSGSRMCKVIEEYYRVVDGTPIMNECMEQVGEKLVRQVPLKKGVPEILAYFQAQGVPMAVASSSSAVQIKANLKNARLSHYFAAVVSGNDVSRGKPAPDIFIYAARCIGCRPEDCYVFEDSVNGVRAGNAAGCKTIMIPDLFPAGPEIVPYCDGIYHDLQLAQLRFASLPCENK